MSALMWITGWVLLILNLASAAFNGANAVVYYGKNPAAVAVSAATSAGNVLVSGIILYSLVLYP